MNVHSLLDLLSVGLAVAPTGRAKFFRDGIDCPRLVNLIGSVELDLPTIAAEGCYEVPARIGTTEVDPAFEVAQWRGAGHPTLLWHHGNNERPLDRNAFSRNSFTRVVWDARDEFDANLIVLRAPLHRSFGEYRRGVVQLAGFSGMRAASARLIEELRAWSLAQGSGPVVVAGISLGGWVTNPHRACFNSADAYAPLLAGATVDHVFVSSVFRWLTAPSALEHPDTLHRALNFEAEFARVPDDNVFPLLARHDQIIVFDRQKHCYGANPIAVLDRGHITGALATRELRQHPLGVLSGAAERGPGWTTR